MAEKYELLLSPRYKLCLVTLIVGGAIASVFLQRAFWAPGTHFFYIANKLGRVFEIDSGTGAGHDPEAETSRGTGTESGEDPKAGNRITSRTRLLGLRAPLKK